MTRARAVDIATVSTNAAVNTIRKSVLMQPAASTIGHHRAGGVHARLVRENGNGGNARRE